MGCGAGHYDDDSPEERSQMEPLAGTVHSASLRKLSFVNGRMELRDSPIAVIERLNVRVTRAGLRVGCTLVEWAAWDELRRIVGDEDTTNR